MVKSGLRPIVVSLLAGAAASTLAACGGHVGGSVASTPVALPPAPAPSPPPSPTPSPPSAPTPTPTPTPDPCASSCTSVPPPTGYVITPSDLQPRRSAQDDDEYRRNYTVGEYINALFALDNDWVGQGVLVGVLDDGVHAVGDLEGKVHAGLSRDFGYVEKNDIRTLRSGNDRFGDASSSHGTPVAGIIAARDDGEGVQGLAPGAMIVSLRVDSMVDGEKVWGTGRDLALRHAADNRIPLVNKSLALRPGTSPSRKFMDALAYYNRRAQGLVVAAAGNNGLDTSATAVEVDPRHAESWLFVAGLKSDGRDFELADYSNRCGSMMNRCVVAPTLSRTVGASGNPQTFGGTSSAAPVVTSVAAMILSKWPQLTGVDAGNIILNSARDLGAPGVDRVYGHGLVDAEAALRPVNPVLSNNAMSVPLEANAMVLGNAFGGLTGASFADAFSAVTVLDQYGRDYTGNLSSLVLQPAAGSEGAMDRQVEAQFNARSAAFASPAGSAIVGVTAFDTGLRDAAGVPVLENRLTNAEIAYRLTDAVTLTGGYNRAGDVTANIMGLAPTSDAMPAYSPLARTSLGIAHRLGRGRLALAGYRGGEGGIGARGAVLQFTQGARSLKLGLLHEDGAVFGTPVGTGMMRFGDGARTWFVEGASGFDLGQWSFEGFASLGRTRLLLGGDTLLTDADSITTGRFGLIASYPALRGRVSFGLAQPLVVLAGDATVSVGSGYDLAARALLLQERKVSLAGEIAPQFTLGYERRGDRSDLRFALARDGAGRDIRGIASWRVRFGR